MVNGHEIDMTDWFGEWVDDNFGVLQEKFLAGQHKNWDVWVYYEFQEYLRGCREKFED